MVLTDLEMVTGGLWQLSVAWPVCIYLVFHAFLFFLSRFPTMRYDSRMVDRQIGRNAELFAQSIADIDTKEERYPYLRILVSLIEQAHPEWKQSPQKVEQMTDLACQLSEDALDADEVKEVIQVRDHERGYHRN
mgnify:CR=1 FL=1